MLIGVIDPATLDDRQKLAAVEREIKYRWRVYAMRVKDGRMSQREMDFQIAVMIAIRDDYRAKVEAVKSLQGSLL